MTDVIEVVDLEDDSVDLVVAVFVASEIGRARTQRLATSADWPPTPPRPAPQARRARIYDVAKRLPTVSG